MASKKFGLEALGFGELSTDIQECCSEQQRVCLEVGCGPLQNVYS